MLFFDKLREKYTNIQKENKIIVISQPSIGERLSKFIAKLADQIPEKFLIIYKMHPKEPKLWKKVFPHLSHDRINVISENTVDLYKLFSISKFQVGVYSTAIYEGMGFGLSTFIVKLPGYEFMKHLSEVIHIVEDPSEIVEGMNKPKSGFNAENFFMKYNKENFINEIDNIISKSIK